MPHSPVLTVHRDREGAPLRVSASARSCQPTVRGPLLRIKWTAAAPGTRSGVRPAIRRPPGKWPCRRSRLPPGPERVMEEAAPHHAIRGQPARAGACRGGGAAVLPVGPGPAPRKIKSDRRPVAGGVGACRPPARLGGCPTPPRSKQHARGAGRCRHFRGAHPRATARNLLRRTRIRALAARARARGRPSTRPHVICRARIGRGPVAFPGRPPPRFRGRVSFVFGLLFSLDMTSLDELGAEHRARTTVRVVVALKSSGSSVAFAGDRPFLILSSQDNSTLNRLS